MVVIKSNTNSSLPQNTPIDNKTAKYEAQIAKAQLEILRQNLLIDYLDNAIKSSKEQRASVLSGVYDPQVSASIRDFMINPQNKQNEQVPAEIDVSKLVLNAILNPAQKPTDPKNINHSEVVRDFILNGSNAQVLGNKQNLQNDILTEDTNSSNQSDSANQVSDVSEAPNANTQEIMDDAKQKFSNYQTEATSSDSKFSSYDQELFPEYENNTTETPASTQEKRTSDSSDSFPIVGDLTEPIDSEYDNFDDSAFGAQENKRAQTQQDLGQNNVQSQDDAQSNADNFDDVNTTKNTSSKNTTKEKSGKFKKFVKRSLVTLAIVAGAFGIYKSCNMPTEDSYVINNPPKIVFPQDSSESQNPADSILIPPSTPDTLPKQIPAPIDTSKSTKIVPVNPATPKDTSNLENNKKQISARYTVEDGIYKFNLSDKDVENLALARKLGISGFFKYVLQARSEFKGLDKEFFETLNKNCILNLNKTYEEVCKSCNYWKVSDLLNKSENGTPQVWIKLTDLTSDLINTNPLSVFDCDKILSLAGMSENNLSKLYSDYDSNGNYIIYANWLSSADSVSISDSSKVSMAEVKQALNDCGFVIYDVLPLSKSSLSKQTSIQTQTPTSQEMQYIVVPSDTTTQKTNEWSVPLWPLNKH